MRAGGDCTGVGRLRCAATGGGSSGRRGNGDANPYARRHPGNGDARLAGHNRRNGGNDSCPHSDALAHRDAVADRNTPAYRDATTYIHAAADGNAVPHSYPNTPSNIDSASHANPPADRYAIGS